MSSSLQDLQAQRTDAEASFQGAMREVEAMLAPTDYHLIATALGYHREVCALYNAERSLVESGKLPSSEAH